MQLDSLPLKMLSKCSINDILDKYLKNLIKLSFSDCSELLHPFLVFMQVLWTYRFVYVFYSLDKIWFAQWCIYFFLKFLHVHDVFISSLIFKFSSHGKHSCLSAKVGYISSAIPFSFLDNLVNLNSLLNLELLEIYFEELSPSLFIWKRDVDSFL